MKKAATSTRPTQDDPMEKPPTPKRTTRKNHDAPQLEQASNASSAATTSATALISAAASISNAQETQAKISSSVEKLQHEKASYTDEKQRAKITPQLLEVGSYDEEAIKSDAVHSDEQKHRCPREQVTSVPGAEHVRGINYLADANDDNTNASNGDNSNENRGGDEEHGVADQLGENLDHRDLITAELVVVEEKPSSVGLVSADVVQEEQGPGLFSQKCLGISMILLALGFVGVLFGLLLDFNNNDSKEDNNNNQISEGPDVVPSLSPFTPEPSVTQTASLSQYPTFLPSLSPTILLQPSMAPTLQHRWVQLGQVLQGDVAHEYGYSTSLSADGTRLAVFAFNNGMGGDYAGVVYVYELTNDMEWKQLGQTLQGESANDYFGIVLSLSGDGTKLASFGNGDENTGAVKVFDMTEMNSEWEQVGQTLNGKAVGGVLGTSLSFSNDGSILAVGAHLNDISLNSVIMIDTGEVEVFELTENNTEWKQLGQTLQGETSGDFFGVSVELSNDGMVLACGAHRNDSGGTSAGEVKVFTLMTKNDIPEWKQLGQALQGDLPSAQFGVSVSLSDDGTRLAASGFVYQDSESLNPAAQVKVFELNTNRTEWELLGQILESDFLTGYTAYGVLVSLASNGNRLAISIWELDNDGSSGAQVEVLELTNNDEEWIRVGQVLNDGEAEDYFGVSVSISEDGATLAVSDCWNDDGGYNSGQVNVYYLDSVV
jgi:hypothetical protein